MSAPLEGLRVLDMGWVMVGPSTGRYLADLGADVVKLESARRMDPLRYLGPFKNATPGLGRSLSYHNINAGKRSLTLDIKHPRGREIILDLVKWADVVIESFSPGVLDSLQLGYTHLSVVNPRLIMLSTSLLGQTGPHAAGTSGVGTMGASLSGATILLGSPDHRPCGTYGPWTDAIGPRFTAISILAALHRRQATGQGCLIDVAQAETGIQFLTPAVYQYTVNGTVPQRSLDAEGPFKAPAGVFRCAGKDRWIAIDASADSAWRALRAIVGIPLADPTFDTLVGRLRNRSALKDAIGQWSKDRDADVLEAQLQAAGVPAHVVSQSADLANDPDLRAVGHYRTVPAPTIDEATIEGPRYGLRRTPLRETSRGPALGEHTREILTDVCGLSSDTIDDLKSAGVLS
jgi:benzylsuccinate CoA-transferase BbsF subunit